MPSGWSINLSLEDPSESVFMIELPVPPLYWSKITNEPVMETVFWSETAQRWVHIVSLHVERDLPRGHIQVTAGDIPWVRSMLLRRGDAGIHEIVRDLEETGL